ncbi:MFS transporter [Lichenifustis flavocetrariae]|uniref:MFS transporter n=1 Tax=Lichenifustis flavocetrariae TaxID=2949735 RepID=A0AA41YZM5_9HYPH|nr:MFS transporter [Lichenifustis flavocetrariae]MCW6510033.1 MFS transporter [Lichenifustis flavocetrariae]
MQKRTGTLIASALGITVVQLNAAVVTVAFASLRQAFSVDVVALQWTVNAYALLLAALLLSAGLLGDRFGGRRVFAAGFGLSALSALGAACATSYSELIGMRALQGVGAAMLLPASLSLLGQVSPNPAARAQAIGTWSAAGSLALALGPVVGGLLIARGGWPVVFLPSVPLCLVGLWLTLRHAPLETGAERAQLDWPGQVVAMIGLASLTWSARSAAQGWRDPEVWVGVAVFVVAAVIFVVVEGRSLAPMVPPKLFRSPALSAVMAARALVNFAYYGLVFVFSLFFQTIQHRSALATGLMFLPMTGSLIAMTVVAGRLCARYGPHRPALAGLAISAGGYLVLLWTGATTPPIVFAVPFFVVGCGVALVVPSLTVACLGAVRSQDSGIASGLLNASAQTGGVLGVALFAAMLATDRSSAFLVGTHAAVLTATAALVLSFILLIRFMKPADVAQPACSSSTDERCRGEVRLHLGSCNGCL